MAEKEKKPFGGLKLAAQKGLASIDMETLKEKAAEATGNRESVYRVPVSAGCGTGAEIRCISGGPAEGIRAVLCVD